MPVKCSEDEKPHMQPKIGSELVESTCRGEARGPPPPQGDGSSDLRYFPLPLSGCSCFCLGRGFCLLSGPHLLCVWLCSKLLAWGGFIIFWH